MSRLQASVNRKFLVDVCRVLIPFSDFYRKCLSIFTVTILAWTITIKTEYLVDET